MAVQLLVTSRNASVRACKAWMSASRSPSVIALLQGASVTITDSILSGNFSNLVGGGIGLEDSTLTLQGCQLTDNAADDYGGMAFIDADSALTLIDSTIEDNDAGYDGAAIYGTGGTITSQESTWDGADIRLEGDSGGAYYLPIGTVSFTCDLTGCQ